VVRVGNQYNAMPTQNNVSGHSGASVFSTGTDNATFVQAMLNAGQDVFVALSEAGHVSTVDAVVDSVSGTNVVLSTAPGALALADDYDGGATVVYSNTDKAAWTARACSTPTATALARVIYRPSTGRSGGHRARNEKATTTSMWPSLERPSLLAGLQDADSTHKTTYEVRVKQVVNNRVFLETSDVTRVGYQALSLQDTYSTAHLYAVNTNNQSPFLYLAAKTPGDWANGSSNKSGLFVQAAPGSGQAPKSGSVLEFAAGGDAG